MDRNLEMPRIYQLSNSDSTRRSMRRRGLPVESVRVVAGALVQDDVEE